MKNTFALLAALAIGLPLAASAGDLSATAGAQPVAAHQQSQQAGPDKLAPPVAAQPGQATAPSVAATVKAPETKTGTGAPVTATLPPAPPTVATAGGHGDQAREPRTGSDQVSGKPDDKVPQAK